MISIGSYHPGDEVVPDYRLIRQLGTGSFGDVWESTAPGGTKCALKLIKIDDSQTGMREFRGIQRVKDIRYANLNPIYGIWMLDPSGNLLDPQAIAQQDLSIEQANQTMIAPPQPMASPALLVVAMGLCEGNLKDCLEAAIEQGHSGIPEDELLDYMDQAARGLDFLNKEQHDLGDGHTVSIQHCDIKPENIMLVGDSVQICDFGIAKVLSNAQNLAATTTGMMGTLYYMSPEMIENKGPSPNTDQYSFACTYYRLRTGHLPFRNDTSVPDILNSHCRGELELNRLPGSSERSVVRKATSPDPGNRYSSNVAFIKALRNSIHEDKHADEIRAARLREIRKRRIRRLLVATMLLLVVGGAGGIYWFLPDVSARLLALMKKDGGTDPPPVVNFEDLVVGPAEEAFARGEWSRAMVMTTEYADLFPDAEEERQALRVDFLGQLITDGDNYLEAGHLDEASKRYSAVLAETDRNDAAYEPQRHAAAFGRANVVLANEDPVWSDLRSSLATLEQESNGFDEAQQHNLRALKVLAAIEANPDRFFEDAVLDDVVKLEEAGEVELSERSRILLQQVKADAAPLLFSTHANKRDDPRVAVVFPRELLELGELLELAQRTTSEFVETGNATNLALLIARVDNSPASPDAGVQSRVDFYRLALRMCDRETDLEDLLVRLDGSELNQKQATTLADILVKRLLKDFPIQPMPASKLTHYQTLVERLKPRLPLTVADRLVAHQRALPMINELHQSQFDYPKALETCNWIRDRKVELEPSFDQFVTACWLDCLHEQLDNGATPTPQETIDEMQQAASKLSTPSGRSVLERYLYYVRARSATAGEWSVEQMTAVFEPPPTPAFVQVENRAQFAGQAFLQAARKLRVSAADNQIVTPAYDEGGAEKALRYLQFMRNAAPNSEVSSQAKRELALASLYSKEADWSETQQRLVGLPLDPRTENDGQLLLARALGWARHADGTPQPEAVQAFADVLQWWTTFNRGSGRSDGSRVVALADCYHRIVQPAQRMAEPYQQMIQGFSDLESPLDVSAVPAPLFEPLATIFGASAYIVEMDVDVELMFPDTPAAVEHRYVYSRAATELHPQRLDYLLGMYNALRDWSTRAWSERLEEMEPIADNALEIAPDRVEAKVVSGEVRIYQARREPVKDVRMELLNAALRLMDVDLSDLSDVNRSRYLVIRSSAHVEAANELEDPDEKKELLNGAIRDAEAAVQIKNRFRPGEAYVAWAHAMEDMAHFAGFDHVPNYEKAISLFVDAEKDPSSRALAVFGRGRCRLRRGQDQFAGKMNAEGLSIAQEMQTAIRELEQAEREFRSTNLKAECHYFTNQARMLLVAHRKRDLDAAAANAKEPIEKEIASILELADQDLSKSVKIVSPHYWATHQLAWAQVALNRAHFGQQDQYAVASKRAEEVLERAREAGDLRVNDLYNGLAIQFFTTPLSQRDGWLDSNLAVLPSSSEGNEAKVSLLLLFAKQYFDKGNLDPLAQGGTVDFAACERRAKEAMELAKRDNARIAEANSLMSLGYMNSTRFLSTRSRDDSVYWWRAGQHWHDALKLFLDEDVPIRIEHVMTYAYAQMQRIRDKESIEAAGERAVDQNETMTLLRNIAQQPQLSAQDKRAIRDLMNQIQQL